MLRGIPVKVLVLTRSQNLHTLADHAEDEETKAEIARMAEDGFSDVTAKRVSILDLLERFPSINMDAGVFLSMLPPMRVRQ